MKEEVVSKSRILKILDIGDSYKKEVKPQIRLQGKWLAAAGLQPGFFVKIINPQSGILLIQCLEK